MFSLFFRKASNDDIEHEGLEGKPIQSLNQTRTKQADKEWEILVKKVFKSFRLLNLRLKFLMTSPSPIRLRWDFRRNDFICSIMIKFVDVG